MDIIGTLALATLVWVVSGWLAYGLTFAYFQREWPGLAPENVGGDRRNALNAALLGPLGLAVVLFSKMACHGFKWRS